MVPFFSRSICSILWPISLYVNVQCIHVCLLLIYLFQIFKFFFLSYNFLLYPIHYFFLISFPPFFAALFIVNFFFFGEFWIILFCGMVVQRIALLLCSSTVPETILSSCAAKSFACSPCVLSGFPWVLMFCPSKHAGSTMDLHPIQGIFLLG